MDQRLPERGFDADTLLLAHAVVTLGAAAAWVAQPQVPPNGNPIVEPKCSRGRVTAAAALQSTISTHSVDSLPPHLRTAAANIERS